MLAFAGGVLAGNLALHQLSALPDFAFVAAVFAGGIAVAWRMRSLLLAGFCAGFFWTSVYATSVIETQLQASFDGQDFSVVGWVDSLPQRSESGVTFSMRVDSRRDALANARLRLNWYETQESIPAGRRLELVVRLRQPHGFANPHGFDYERWLMQEGYAATGYVRSGQVLSATQPGLAAAILRGRARLSQRLADIGLSPRARPLIAALGLGDRSDFAEEQWDTFRRTGTSHLMAISGLHIALLGATAFGLMSAMLRRVGGLAAAWQLEIASGVALAAACVYALLAGFALPTRRALVMLGFALAAVLARRSTSAMHALSAAAVLVLAFDPLATLSPSFWLSFGAVAVLVACAAARRARLVHEQRRRRTFAMCIAAVRLQTTLTLALIPLGVVFFGSISVVAAPVNLLAIPVFTIVVIPMVLLSLLGLLVGTFGNWLVHLTGFVCEFVGSSLHWVSMLPWSQVEAPRPGVATLVVALAGVLLALPWHRSPGRRLGWFAVLVGVFPAESHTPYGVAEATVLDVGHGLAVVIDTQTHRMVFDAGARFRSGFDVGSEIVVPALRSGRRRDLDLLVISHADNDHSGGATAVMSSFPHARVMHGTDVKIENGEVCEAGERWRWDGVEFAVLYPEPGYTGMGNDASCVVLVTAGSHRLLLTGDIERRGESALAATAGLTADVVIVPHHGSATSSSREFVERVSAHAAVVSAGYRNRWGFPVPEVRSRWKQAGAAVYVTGEQGAVHIRIGDDALELVAERLVRPRYWRVRPG